MYLASWTHNRSLHIDEFGAAFASPNSRVNTGVRCHDQRTTADRLKQQSEADKHIAHPLHCFAAPNEATSRSRMIAQ